MDKKWLMGVIGGFLGFAISTFITYFTFRVNLETTKNVEIVRLAREFTKDFYENPENPVYMNIRRSIESCEKLYWNGKFTNDEINRYLGFFDDLGFYYKKG